MNRPIEDQYTELLIERNAYRAFLMDLASDRYDRVSPGVKAEALKLITGRYHPASDPDHYRSDKE